MKTNAEIPWQLEKTTFLKMLTPRTKIKLSVLAVWDILSRTIWAGVCNLQHNTRLHLLFGIFYPEPNGRGFATPNAT